MKIHTKTFLTLALVASFLVVFLLPVAVFAQSADFSWNLTGGSNPTIRAEAVYPEEGASYEWQVTDLRGEKVFLDRTTETPEIILTTNDLDSGQNYDLKLNIRDNSSGDIIFRNYGETIAIPKLTIDSRCFPTPAEEGEIVEIYLDTVPGLAFFGDRLGRNVGSNPEIIIFENGNSLGAADSIYTLPYTYHDGQRNRTYRAEVTFPNTDLQLSTETIDTSIYNQYCGEESGVAEETKDEEVDEETNTGNEVTLTNTESGNYKFLEPIPGVGSEVDVSNDEGFQFFVKDIITLVMGFAILAAVVMIVAAGLQYMTSRSQSGTGEAKQRIQNAVLGLVLALASVVILQTINPQLIEIKTVSTVTTSGSSFTIASSITDFGGTAINEEGDWKQRAARRFCWRLEGEFWTVSGDRDQDLQICHSTEAACNNSRDSALEEYGEGWDGVDSQCLYYYESIGKIIHTEPDPDEVLQDNIITVISSAEGGKEGVVNACKNNAREIARSNHTQCLSVSNTGEPQFNYEACDVQCSEPIGKPKPLPDGWSAMNWCPTNLASPLNGECRQEESTCESLSESGSCYQNPTGQAFGKSTSCIDCRFIDQSHLPAPTPPLTNNSGVFPTKGFICSGNGGEYCRIKNDLLTKLNNLYTTLEAAEWNFIVSQAFPPTREHADSCHYDGSCVDIGVRPLSLRDGPKDDLALYLDSFFRAARSEGLDVCYEVSWMGEKEEILNADESIPLPAKNIMVVEGISAPHFSVYLNQSNCSL